MSLAGMGVNCTCSVTAVSCEEFSTDQLSISWQISTTDYICLGNVKWSGGGQFSWIKSAHQFIIHQTAGVFRTEEKGRREKSLIFNSHSSLCTWGLTTGLREPDEFKASEESWVKESQIRTEIPLENLINQECLWRGEYALKDHLDFPTLTFILSCLHWEHAFKDKISSCSTTLKEAGLMFCLQTVYFLSVIKTGNGHVQFNTQTPQLHNCTTLELHSRAEVQSGEKNEARRRGPVKILCHPVLTWTLCYLGWHPGFSVKISVILWEAFTDRPTSCRHLFLSALPDVIIIRDPEWTFVAHGPVFR